MSSLSNIEGDNFKPFYRRYNLYPKTFRYAYEFLLENNAKKNEIPYTHMKCNGKKTLKNLFLGGLPVCFTNHLYDKTHKRLNRLKSLENLMRYTGKAVHFKNKTSLHFRKKWKQAILRVLIQFKTKLQFSWLKLSRIQKLVVNSKGSKNYALEKFYEFWTITPLFIG